jgi:hypothetical protein
MGKKKTKRRIAKNGTKMAKSQLMATTKIFTFQMDTIFFAIARSLATNEGIMKIGVNQRKTRISKNNK